MDLVTVFKVLLRRWGIVLPGLVLVIIVTIYAGRAVAPTYRAQGSLLLLPPNPPTADDHANSSNAKAPPSPPSRPNPYRELGLDGTAVVLTQAVSSADVVQELAATGATGGYQVKNEDRSPIITIVATGANEDEAITTDVLVMKRVQRELLDRQRESGASPDTFIRTDVLRTSQVEELAGSKSRVMVAAFFLGIALVASLALAVESIATRRRRNALPVPEPMPAASSAFDEAGIDEPAAAADDRFDPLLTPLRSPASDGHHPPSRRTSRRRRRDLDRVDRDDAGVLEDASFPSALTYEAPSASMVEHAPPARGGADESGESNLSSEWWAQYEVLFDGLELSDQPEGEPIVGEPVAPVVAPQPFAAARTDAMPEIHPQPAPVLGHDVGAEPELPTIIGNGNGHTPVEEPAEEESQGGMVLDWWAAWSGRQSARQQASEARPNGSGNGHQDVPTGDSPAPDGWWTDEIAVLGGSGRYQRERVVGLPNLDDEGPASEPRDV